LIFKTCSEQPEWTEERRAAWVFVYRSGRGVVNSYPSSVSQSPALQCPLLLSRFLALALQLDGVALLNWAGGSPQAPVPGVSCVERLGRRRHFSRLRGWHQI